jgi:hypothetical protein
MIAGAIREKRQKIPTMTPLRAFIAAGLVVLSGCASSPPGPAGDGTAAPEAGAPGGAATAAPAPGTPAGSPATGTDVTPFGDAYYLGTCATCDGLLGMKGDTADRVIAGRDVRFCRDECRQKFEAQPGSSFARLDRVMIADQLPLYPASTSIVSGRALGAGAVDFICGNRLFRVCTPEERAQVMADPGAYFKALDQAVVEAQGPTYGMPTKCPVQGDILASDFPRDIVVANRMIRVCCARCARTVRGRPSQYLSMVDYANREAAARREAE